MTAARFEAALAEAGVTAATLSQAEREGLDREGYLILRGVFDVATLEILVETFERRYVPSDQWPFPRGWDARHAMLNDELAIRRACLAPRILAAAHHLLKRRFYLADVQGRDPRQGGGEQRLHRDWVAPKGPAPMVIALAFLDAFGPANGATRLLPGSHRESGGADAYADCGPNHPGQVVTRGEAGDVVVMDGYLVHGGTRNRSEEHRRNLQINFRAQELYVTDSMVVAMPQAPASLRYLFGED
jgi:ectoine hydroxylase-related dioxygenase (phytanoyl-CoA dioxygenase family)